MIGAPRRAAADKRAWPARSPAVRVAGRPAVAGPRLAAIRLGPGGAGLGAARAPSSSPLAAGVLAWGTWLSWCFFAFAFLAHVSSTTDAIRQGSFPVYSRRTAVPMIAGSLAVLLYLPVLLTLALTAWPGRAPDRTRSVYLVNCWAYRSAGPRRGHWVWLRLPPGRPAPRGRESSPWPARKSSGPGVSGGSTARVPGAWPPSARRPGPRLAASRSRPDQVLVEPEEEAGSLPRPVRSSWSPRTRSSAAPGPSTIPSGIAACSDRPSARSIQHHISRIPYRR